MAEFAAYQSVIQLGIGLHVGFAVLEGILQQERKAIKDRFDGYAQKIALPSFVPSAADVPSDKVTKVVSFIAKTEKAEGFILRTNKTASLSSAVLGIIMILASTFAAGYPISLGWGIVIVSVSLGWFVSAWVVLFLLRTFPMRYIEKAIPLDE